MPWLGSRSIPVTPGQERRVAVGASPSVGSKSLCYGEAELLTA
jgi:hypothetical protein